MIQVNQTKTGLNIEVATTSRSNRQRRAIQDLLKSGDLRQLIDYLSSLNGKYHYVAVPRYSSKGVDKLADKEPGAIKALFDKMLDTDASHRPIDSQTSWIGVEIECMIPFSSVPGTQRTCPDCDGRGYHEATDEDGEPIGETEDCHRCGGLGYLEDPSTSRAHGKLAEVFKAERIKYASIKSDGSIHAEEGCFPVEITVLTRLNSPENLKRCCEVLRKLGAMVNKSCGMHVHLDARHLNEDQVREVGTKFKRCMPVLAAMVPPSRRSNRFCQLSVSKLHGDRYYAVNLTAFRKYRTIEIRLHSSTTDFDKIIHWSRLLSCIATAERPKRVVNSLNELTEFVYIPEATLEFATQRTSLFSPEPTCAPQYRDADSSENQLEIGA